jgi:hypothetical protein
MLVIFNTRISNKNNKIIVSYNFDGLLGAVRSQGGPQIVTELLTEELLLSWGKFFETVSAVIYIQAKLALSQI